MRTDPAFASATELSTALGAAGVSAVEATQAILARIETYDATVGAFITVDPQGALNSARAADERRHRGQTLGPLDGVPISIKDFLFTRGLRTTAGSALFAHFVPDTDAVVVERLRAHGAVILGKTATPEFCHKTVTKSPLFATTRNPWDVTRTAGGSSGGSAAAVAAGFGPLSIGTDGGGSIRLPAALCGVAGLKPSTGLVPQAPGFDGWDLLGHTGPLARTAADIRLVLRAIAGPDGRDPASLRAFASRPPRSPLRIAVARSLNHLQPDDDVADGFDVAVAAARALGCEIVPVQVSWTDPDLRFRVILASDLAAALARHLPSEADRMDPMLVKIVEFGAAQSAIELAQALNWRRDFTRHVLRWFEDFDLLLVPTTPVTAFPLGGVGPTTIAGRKASPYDWFSWTWPFNITGQPALSLPVWGSGPRPVGLQIVGRPGTDFAVLDFAEALERAMAQPLRRPALG